MSTRASAFDRADALLEVHDLQVRYRGRRRSHVDGVAGVSLSIYENETLGLVGESGSGKTTLGRAVMGMVPVHAGHIRYAGREISGLTTKERRGWASQLQMIFQDPYSSLSPVRTVGQTLAEPLQAQRCEPAEIRSRVGEVLEQVGLNRAAAKRYPRQFSGGQRQRIAIARALVARPRLIVCDEPVSSLDLSIQAQIINLLDDLKREMALSYLFISHDLSLVRTFADRVIVMSGGRIVEAGPVERVYADPQDPYTKRLLEAAPIPDPRLQRKKHPSGL